MPIRFTVTDLYTIERPGSSSHALRSKLGDVLAESTAVRARIDNLNSETGEYRITLLGTLHRRDSGDLEHGKPQ